MFTLKAQNAQADEMTTQEHTSIITCSLAVKDNNIVNIYKEVSSLESENLINALNNITKMIFFF